MVSFRAVSSMSRPRKELMATDDDRCVRLRIRQRKRAALVPEHRDGRGPFSLPYNAPVPVAGALVRSVAFS
jgi:hypothetical protein